MSVAHARSFYSIGESLLSPKDIASDAAALGYSAASIADTMSISGLMDFTKQCKEKSIKPIVGARVRIVEDPTYRVPKKNSGEKKKDNPEWFLDLYIANEAGFKDLCELLSKGFTEEYFYYVPRVSFADVLEVVARGSLVVVTADDYSVFHKEDYSAHIDSLKSAIEQSSALVSDRLFMRLHASETPLFEQLNKRALTAASQYKIHVLPSYTALYKDGNADTRDVYQCVTSNTKISSPWRRVPYDRERGLIPQSQIISKLLKTLNITSNTGEQAFTHALMKGDAAFEASISYTWSKADISLPKLAENEPAELVKLCLEGWQARFSKPVFGHVPDHALLNTEYKDRLKYELSVLSRMNFCGYFLLVRDIVMWSKSQGILVGPGRGSVGGSLVAYLIGITDVDPIRFGLLFERFLNPDRLDYPDADLDFMTSRRHEVFTYLKKKYGTEHVACISNYGTLGGSSALRDTGRIYDLSHQDLNCTKMIDGNLEEAVKLHAPVAQFRDAHPDVWKHAVAMEGAVRNIGKHAAGAIVASVPIVDRAVVSTRKGSSQDDDGGLPQINWDKRYCEDQGLIKLDILGLNTLDLLKIAQDQIKKNHNKEIDLLALPLDDQKTLESFGNGDTVSVFQFESPGMRNLLKSLNVGGGITFEEVYAATALYRPGPIEAGMVDQYIQLKQGTTSPSFTHPALQEPLKETSGVMVYQEQTMQMAQSLSGFSMAEADGLRKAIGKKQPEEMAKYKDRFVNQAMLGCISVTLEDGRNVVVHRANRFKVKQVDTMHTIEEILQNGYELQDGQL